MAYGTYRGKWDDLTVNPNSLPDIGADFPPFKIVANDGSTTTGIAAEFAGVGGGTVGYYADMSSASMSISAWIKPDSLTGEIIDRNGSGGFEFYIGSGNLVFSPDGAASTSVSGILTGATQFVTVTAEDSGGNIRVKLYINGSLVANQLKVGSQLAASTDGYVIGEWNGGGGWEFDGVIDNLQVYNVVLTAAQITELYNAGEGVAGVPTGVTEATELIASLFTNETAGQILDNYCTLGAGHDISTVDIDETDGLIGVTSGSIGIASRAWPADRMTNLFFDVQLLHQYEEGSEIRFHVHWAKAGTGTGNVVWGLEYVWVNVNGTIGNTTVVTNTIAVPADATHEADTVVAISGTGKTISSVLSCRVFRWGDHADDTYAGDVYMSQCDFHYQKDSLGSHDEWTK